ncbi:hypothetical protein OWR29_19080 [Actinoplanes sp. Pm04-4]|uniref:Antitoxin VbhA domain-containing protein n=1 Tax=Paractinoplanes pyxinae TaxID=2997416 RepID=A0ABT4B212_9ACTN|nr:hypothetical protein [Actinoplanes pyxinae]MCY1140112.1 hypothetical protein [Actinoplanes pyxinae]
MNASAGSQPIAPRPGRLTVDELIRAKDARPIRSQDDLDALAADVFESDEELDQFLDFTYAERQRDLA